MPNYLGHADNYIAANPRQTPAHIVPEWYYLPFYAILRAIPTSSAAVALFGARSSILAFLPWLDTFKVRSAATARVTSFLLAVRRTWSGLAGSAASRRGCYVLARAG